MSFAPRSSKGPVPGARAKQRGFLRSYDKHDVATQRARAAFDRSTRSSGNTTSPGSSSRGGSGATSTGEVDIYHLLVKSAVRHITKQDGEDNNIESYNGATVPEITELVKRRVEKKMASGYRAHKVPRAISELLKQGELIRAEDRTFFINDPATAERIQQAQRASRAQRAQHGRRNEPERDGNDTNTRNRNGTRRRRKADPHTEIETCDRLANPQGYTGVYRRQHDVRVPVREAEFDGVRFAEDDEEEEEIPSYSFKARQRWHMREVMKVEEIVARRPDNMNLTFDQSYCHARVVLEEEPEPVRDEEGNFLPGGMSMLKRRKKRTYGARPLLTTAAIPMNRFQSKGSGYRSVLGTGEMEGYCYYELLVEEGRKVMVGVALLPRNDSEQRPPNSRAQTSSVRYSRNNRERQSACVSTFCEGAYTSKRVWSFSCATGEIWHDNKRIASTGMCMEAGDMVRVLVDTEVEEDQHQDQGRESDRDKTAAGVFPKTARLVFLVKRQYGDHWEQLPDSVDIDLAVESAGRDQVLVPVVEMVRGCKVVADW